MDQSRGPIMAWNVFRCCTVLRALGFIMIIVVLGLVGFTYYAVVLADYGPALFYGGLDSFTAFAVLALFHALLVMLLWSYFSVVLTDPGGVPPNWRPKIDEERCGAGPLEESAYIGPTLASHDFGVLGELGNQNKGYCRKCNQFKPPRSHHCSVCGRCVLKMDHHCIWVVNCVGALNYKYFLLFLFYTFLETTLVTLSLLPYFMAFFSDVEISGTPSSLAVSFIAFVLNLAFAISIMGFMVVHMLLVASNTTTIEAFEKNTATKWSYNLGWKNNYEQVFGTKKRFWLIPTYSSEDLRRMPALHGLEYPMVLDVEVEAFQPL